MRGYLGLLASDGKTTRLLAASGVLDEPIDWRHTDFVKKPMALDDSASQKLAPTSIAGLDLAPYTIAPNQTAIGIRVAWQEMYSGGGAEYTALVLVAVQGDRLRPVLGVPISAFSDIAGDWHKDGTRDHQIYDAANILIISSHQTHRHFDLLLKSRTIPWSRIYRWRAATHAYFAAP